MSEFLQNEPNPSSEFGLIRWIRERAARSDRVALGIGDDCALIEPTPGCKLVVTTDMLMDGRHFRLEEAGAEAVGRKAMGVNISDIAAMAARPVAAVVAVALPRRPLKLEAVAHGLHMGLGEMANRFDISLVGGDTNAWDGPLVICVTLLGETTLKGAVLRSGAKVGDAIFVTGPLGGSLLGRHLSPQPRVVEAIALHEAAKLHALIDISDGLSSDLGHILDESGGLGAELDADSIPIHPDAIEIGKKTGRSALEHALTDGEDFELCLTASQADADRLDADPPVPARLFRVGRVVRKPGIRLVDPDGIVRPVQPGGFDHFRD